MFLLYQSVSRERPDVCSRDYIEPGRHCYYYCYFLTNQVGETGEPGPLCQGEAAPHEEDNSPGKLGLDLLPDQQGGAARLAGRPGRDDEEEDDDGQSRGGGGDRHGALQAGPAGHEAGGSEEPEEDEEGEEDQGGDLVEGDGAQLPVLLSQHLRHSAALRVGLALSSPAAGEEGEEGASEVLQTGPEEVELEDKPEQQEVDHHVGEAEHHPGAEVEGMTGVSREELHQDQVGRSSYDGPSTPDISRVGHTAQKCHGEV